METVRTAITMVLVLAGIIVCGIGVYGVFKFRYAANRMHAAAVNDTLGIGLCLLGLAVSAPDWGTALKMLLVIVFLWIASPVASHMVLRLEIETNEERDKYMTVHGLTAEGEKEENER